MNNKILFFSLFCLFAIGLTSCLSDDCTDQRSYYQYNPVYMTKAQFRVDIETESQHTLKNPGKMYYYNDYLFINEQGMGVHVYNNQDPNNPVYEVFYRIPGNFDIVIRDGILIADNVIDMISVDVSDIYNPILVNRVENYKEEYEYADNQQFYAYSTKNLIKEIVDCSDSNFNNDMFWRGDVFFTRFETANVLDASASTGSIGSGTGIGGSSARFTIVDNYMYVVDDYSLKSYEISNPSSPEYKSTNQLGWGIETIFPYKENLFIGSNAGMYIYSISNPSNPLQIATFQHARACDPVVVEGDYAYVTLRDGSACEGYSNQLEVIDISTITNPNLVKIYPMQNPHGLSVYNDVLYLSEGDYGLKILDVSDKEKVKEIAFDTNIKSTDVIYLGEGHLLSVGSDGFHQLDVTDPKNVKELSFIPVDRN